MVLNPSISCGFGYHISADRSPFNQQPPSISDYLCLAFIISTKSQFQQPHFFICSPFLNLMFMQFEASQYTVISLLDCGLKDFLYTHKNLIKQHKHTLKIIYTVYLLCITIYIIHEPSQNKPLGGFAPS